MKAVVLAAGYATRMYPLTRGHAKPLLEVGGRPVLSWIVDRLVALGGLEGLVVVHNSRFAAQFEEWHRGYRAALPIELHDDGSTGPEDRRGAVGDLALGVAHPLPDEREADPRRALLVLAGDNLIELDLAPHAARFRELDAPLVLCRRLAGPVPARRYGEILAGADGRILRLREKPERPESPLVSTCAYFLPADVRADLARYLAERDDHDVAGDFIAWLVARRPVFADTIRGGFHDIGDLDSLEEARRRYASSTRRPSAADT